MSEEVICRRLAGRTAVVTGAGSGIGRAAAHRLASQAAPVVCGAVDEARGKAVAEETGGLYAHVDVTDPEQVEALFRTAYDSYRSVAVAFSNAGIPPPGDHSTPETGPDAR